MNNPHVVEASHISLQLFHRLSTAAKPSSLTNVASATFLRASAFSLAASSMRKAEGNIR